MLSNAARPSWIRFRVRSISCCCLRNAIDSKEWNEPRGMNGGGGVCGFVSLNLARFGDNLGKKRYNE